MPSKSEKQHHLMLAAAHGWKKSGGGGPSKKVAQEFLAADKQAGKFQGKKQRHQFGQKRKTRSAKP